MANRAGVATTIRRRVGCRSGGSLKANIAICTIAPELVQMHVWNVSHNKTIMAKLGLHPGHESGVRPHVRKIAPLSARTSDAVVFRLSGLPGSPVAVRARKSKLRSFRAVEQLRAHVGVRNHLIITVHRVVTCQDLCAHGLLALVLAVITVGAVCAPQVDSS